MAAEKDELLARLAAIRERENANIPELTTRAAQPEQLVLAFYDLSDLDLPFSLKSDMASMEAPLFSLATQPDPMQWSWSSVDGKKSVSVRGDAVLGRATQHDKDVLLFCISKLSRSRRQNKGDRAVRFYARDYLAATGRSTARDDYDRLEQAIKRLAGTVIETNIRPDRKKGQYREMRVFGLIEQGRYIAPDQDRRRAIVEIVLSKWLWDAVSDNALLTLHPGYFDLRKPLERRLYEIARKHVGKQGSWTITLINLLPKCGIREASERTLRDFRASIKAIIKDDAIPEYRLLLKPEDTVLFYSRDLQAVLKTLVDKS